MRHRGQVLSKTQLLADVWGYEHYDVNLVEVHVSALRRKLEAYGPRGAPHRPWGRLRAAPAHGGHDGDRLIRECGRSACGRPSRAALVALLLSAAAVLAPPAAAAPQQVTPEQPRAGQPIKVQAGGFAPSSLVAVVLGEPPTKIGEGLVGPDGAVSVDAVLPAVLPAGPLGLRVVGVDADGSPRSVAVSVDLTTGLATSGADLRLVLVAVALVGGGHLLVSSSGRTLARLVAVTPRARIVIRRRVAPVPAPTVIRLRRRGLEREVADPAVAGAARDDLRR